MRNSVNKTVAIVIFLSGAIDIVSAFFGHGRFIRAEEFFPLEVVNASRTFTLLSGFSLVYLSRGLWQRKRRAWLLSLLLLAGSFIAHLLKGPDLGEAAFALAACAMMALESREFYVRTPRIRQSERLRAFAVFFLMLFAYSLAGHFLIRRQFAGEASVANIIRDFANSVFGVGQETLAPLTHRARWFRESVGWVGFMALMFALRSLLGPALDKRRPTAEDSAEVRELVKKYGANSGSYFALMPDKKYFFGARGQGAVAYREAQGTAVALGDPICPEEIFSELVGEFISNCASRGVVPVFANAGEGNLGAYRAAGLKTVLVGEEALVSTETFSLAGPGMKDIRNSVSRLNREKALFDWYDFTAIPSEVYSKLDDLHRKWLANKKIPPLGFSVDFYPFPEDPAGKLLTVFGPAGRMMAAFSFLPFDREEGMVMDLMLRSPAAPNGTVEAALAEAMRFFRERGVKTVSLGVAPLSDAQGGNEQDMAMRAKKIIFENFNQFYRYRPLFEFKKKFQPVWAHKYLVYRSGLELPKVALALAAVHIRGNLAVSFLKKYL